LGSNALKHLWNDCFRGYIQLRDFQKARTARKAKTLAWDLCGSCKVISCQKMTIPNISHALMGFKRSETLWERLLQSVYPLERLPKGKDS
jgi:hypothetical protein